MLPKGSEGLEGVYLREVRVKRESASILLFVLGAGVGLLVTALVIETRRPGWVSGLGAASTTAPAPGRSVREPAAKKAHAPVEAAALTSRAHPRPEKKASHGPKASLPASPSATPGAGPEATPGSSATPAASEHSSAGDGARGALEEDVERALGGRAHVRWDVGRALVPRSVSFEGARPIPGTPEVAAAVVARAVLEAVGDSDVAVVRTAGEVPATGRSLVVSPALDTRGASLVGLAAFVEGVPFEDGALKVELSPTAEGQVPVRLVGRLHPSVGLAGDFAPQVESEALARSPAVVRGGMRAEPSVVHVAYETAPGVARRALELTVPGATGSRREIVDGDTGAVLASWALSCSGLAEVESWERDPRGKRTVQPLPSLDVHQGRKHAVTDADGKDSLTGDVDLPLGLDAPFLRVWPDGYAPIAYSGPADFTLLSGRGDVEGVHQDEASAFVFATTYNAYFQETYPEASQAAQIRYAMLVASDFDNAYFDPEQIANDDGESFPGYVDLGIIHGRSAARNASVVRHEDTHAILNGVATLYGTDESLGINEGLADFFPCAFPRAPPCGRMAESPYVRGSWGQRFR